MNIKIVSDGKGWNTHIYDVDTGKEIEGAEFVKWEVPVDGLATATIRFVKIPIEVQAKLDEIEIKKVVTETTSFGKEVTQNGGDRTWR